MKRPKFLLKFCDVSDTLREMQYPQCAACNQLAPRHFEILDPQAQRESERHEVTAVPIICENCLAALIERYLENL